MALDFATLKKLAQEAEQEGYMEQKVFTEVPEGTYNCTIKQLEYTETKSAQDPMLKFTYEISEGQYSGSQIIDYKVIGYASNPTASWVKMNIGAVTKLFRGCGILKPEETFFDAVTSQEALYSLCDAVNNNTIDVVVGRKLAKKQDNPDFKNYNMLVSAN